MVPGACNVAVRVSDVWLFSPPHLFLIHRNSLTYYVLAALSRTLSEEVSRCLLVWYFVIQVGNEVNASSLFLSTIDRRGLILTM